MSLRENEDEAQRARAVQYLKDLPQFYDMASMNNECVSWDTQSCLKILSRILLASHIGIQILVPSKEIDHL